MGKPKQPSFHDSVEPAIFPDLQVVLPEVDTPEFILSRRDVTLTGYRVFTDRDGTFHTDESFVSDAQREMETGHFGSEQFFLHEAACLKGTEIPGVYTRDAGGRPVVEVQETVLFIGANEAPNYGAFMFRVLPKIAALSDLGDPTLKILAPLYPPALQAYLEMAGVSGSQIIPHDFAKVYRFHHVLIPSLRNRDLWMNDATRALFRRLRLNVEPPASKRRVYLSRTQIARTGGGERVMLNEPEVRDLLISFGFEPIAPETLTINDQIALFASASHIVAAGGSALYNAAFCEPGTKYIDIEAEPHWGRGHIRWLASAGLDYGMFEGTPTRDFSVPHQPFTVDVPRLKRRLEAFI